MTPDRGTVSTLPDRVQPGQWWRSRDPRDGGMLAEVIASDGPAGFVTIKRLRKSRVRYARFVSAYEHVRHGESMSRG